MIVLWMNMLSVLLWVKMTMMLLLWLWLILLLMLILMSWATNPCLTSTLLNRTPKSIPP